ncbi:MAG: NfeD family protein [Candidatus Izemoplasmatales bacterium]|jgi:membrane protein implicated in regulation of membrane protease activity|nr:NfeD family protein [Candidatus Izemoplasmatales bacterium]MDD3865522.1 NfeD family protein [Candidatus Izemoplasmatales bacterium]
MLLTIDIGVTATIIWFAIVIFAGIIEASTMDLTSIWFAAGALVALIVSLFVPDLIVQVIVFVVISAALLLSLRPIFTRYLKKNDIKTNADRLIGKIAVCTKAITDGQRGEVKIDGKIWTSISNEDIVVGEKVEVLGIEGVKLVVKKVE